MPNDSGAYMSVTAAAKILGISGDAVRKLMDRRKVRCLDIDGKGRNRKPCRADVMALADPDVLEMDRWQAKRRRKESNEYQQRLMRQVD